MKIGTSITFSTGDTPEGCRIQSVYWVRHINEFPGPCTTPFVTHGYSRSIDISLRLLRRSFDPMRNAASTRRMRLTREFRSVQGDLRLRRRRSKRFADIPPDLLAKYEAKVGVLKMITPRISRQSHRPLADATTHSYSLRDNSMWFYPDGFAPDYGIEHATKAERAQMIGDSTRAADLFLAGTVRTCRAAFDAEPYALPADGLRQSCWMRLKGKPTPDFDAAKAEPGGRHARYHHAGHAPRTSTRRAPPSSRSGMSSPMSPIQNTYKLVSVILRPGRAGGRRAFFRMARRIFLRSAWCIS